MTHRLLRALALGFATAVVLAVLLANAFAQDAGPVVNAICSDSGKAFLVWALGVIGIGSILTWSKRVMAMLPQPVQHLINFAALNWRQIAVDAGKLSAALLVCAIVACAGATDIATKLASPQGAALIAGLENFTPGISAAANAAINGQAAQNDKAMACQGIMWANAADLLFGSDLSPSAQGVIGPALAGAQTACNSPTTDIASVVQTASQAFLATLSALKQAGAPITVAAPAVAPAAS
jgi:hypothetical protein